MNGHYGIIIYTVDGEDCIGDCIENKQYNCNCIAVWITALAPNVQI